MITGVFGLPGSGKSLFLGYVANRAINHKDINSHSLRLGTCRSYERVFTNFPCDGAYKLDFETLGKVEYRNCLILVDEIMMLADSRNFKNFGENLKFFFSMHRHFHVDLIYASQSYDDVDKKIRGVTDRLYYIDDWFFNCMRVRQIVSFFDVSGGRINEGYEYTPPITNVYFYRPKLYKFADSFAVFNNSTIKDEIVLVSWSESTARKKPL